LDVVVIFILFIIGPQIKKKKTEHILKEVLLNIVAEKEERKEEAKRKEALRKESRLDREDIKSK